MDASANETASKLGATQLHLRSASGSELSVHRQEHAAHALHSSHSPRSRPKVCKFVALPLLVNVGVAWCCDLLLLNYKLHPHLLHFLLPQAATNKDCHEKSSINYRHLALTFFSYLQLNPDQKSSISRFQNEVLTCCCHHFARRSRRCSDQLLRSKFLQAPESAKLNKV